MYTVFVGWLMTRKLWDEMGPKWPKGFWDDWLREPDQRKGRVTIRPEVSRSGTFGEDGTSEGQFFEQIAMIKINKDPIDFSKINLNYLLKVCFFGWLVGSLIGLAASTQVVPYEYLFV
jgi:alpha-1,3-mannosyl-glycoprotein beta-1,2-N-acetylglucosaminyltransferase